MRAKIKTFPQIYIGDSIADEKIFLIKHRLKHGKGKYFVVTPSESDNELLEILEAKYLIAPFYKNRLFIIGGIAGSKSEAAELVRQMVEDCQRKRGDLDLKEYISCGRFF